MGALYHYKAEVSPEKRAGGVEEPASLAMWQNRTQPLTEAIVVKFLSCLSKKDIFFLA